VKNNEKLKVLFDDRVPSYKFFLQNVTNHNLGAPLLNILQFVCDLLVNKTESISVSTQTKSGESFVEIQKVSPIKHEHPGDFLTEPDMIFETSHEGDNLLRNVNLQTERLAKLHKQISETMQTNKMILINPLKGDHSRSRSENISKYLSKG
jgi:hypothetical protein